MNIKNEKADKYSESAMVNTKSKHADKTSVIGSVSPVKHWSKSLVVIITQTNECPAHRFQPSTSRDSRNRPQASQTSRPRRNDGNQEATSRSLLTWTSKDAWGTSSQSMFRSTFQTKPFT